MLRDHLLQPLLGAARGFSIVTLRTQIIRLTSKRRLDMVDDGLGNGRGVYTRSDLSRLRQTRSSYTLTCVDIAQGRFPDSLFAAGPVLLSGSIDLRQIPYLT